MGNDVFMGRQPIFDDRMEVVAYDLLYRDSEANEAHVRDAAAATSRVIVDALIELGIERLAGDRPVLIKMDPDFLGNERLLALPPERAMFELLDTPRVTGELVAAARALTGRGYRIALGDFFHTEEWERLLPFIHLAKVRVNSLNRFQVEHQVKELRRYPVMRVAAGVEDPASLERCRALGFDAFEGHFLARPEVTRARRMPTATNLALRLLAELNNPDTGAPAIEALIVNEVSLGCRLLRYMNTPHFALSRRVESLRQAIVLLGLTSVRRWASLIAMLEVNDKPHELLVTAMVRARMAEQLAGACAARRPESYFTVGLFSVLDALTDMPMDQALLGLPFADAVRDALLGDDGPMTRVLAGVIAYEQADWPRVNDHLDLPIETVRAAYLEAIAWADETSAALHGAP